LGSLVEFVTSLNDRLSSKIDTESDIILNQDMKKCLERAATVIKNKQNEKKAVYDTLVSSVQNTKIDPKAANLNELTRALFLFRLYEPRPVGDQAATHEEALALEQEIERDLEQLNEVQRLKENVERIDSQELAKLKSMNSPNIEIENVVKAMLLLLGEKVNDLKGTPSKSTWQKMSPKLGNIGKEGILKRINQFNINAKIPMKKRKICVELIEAYDSRMLQSISETVSYFYAFVKGTLDIYIAKNEDAGGERKHVVNDTDEKELLTEEAVVDDDNSDSNDGEQDA